MAGRITQFMRKCFCEFQRSEFVLQNDRVNGLAKTRARRSSTTLCSNSYEKLLLKGPLIMTYPI